MKNIVINRVSIQLDPLLSEDERRRRLNESARLLLENATDRPQTAMTHEPIATRAVHAA